MPRAGKIVIPPVTSESGEWQHNGSAFTTVDRDPRVQSKDLHLNVFRDGGKGISEKALCAQLLHYALPYRKTKAAALKVLKDAFERNGGQLHVPTALGHLERQLKADFEAKNAAAVKTIDKREKRQATQAEMARVADAATAASKSKSRARASDKPAGKVKAAPTARAPKPAARAVPLTAKPRASGSRKRALTGGDEEDEDVKPPKRQKKTSTIKCSLPAANLRAIFDIDAPQITDEWPSDYLTLTLVPSDGQSHLWGSFEFGILEGYMRSTTSVAEILKTKEAFFTCRSRETGEGQINFAPDQDLEVRFLANGGVRGTGHMAYVGNFSFTGTKLPDSVNPDICLTFKREYYELNQDAYDYESASRWGGWHHKRETRVFTSDTEGEV